MLEIVIQSGRKTRPPQRIDPATGAITIGRSSGNHIVLADKSVSRTHCQIEQDADGVLIIRDLNSRGGTIINAHRVTTWPLTGADVVRVGPFELRISFIDGAESLDSQPSVIDAANSETLPPPDPARVRDTTLEDLRAQRDSYRDRARLAENQCEKSAEQAKAIERSFDKQVRDLHQALKQARARNGNAQQAITDREESLGAARLECAALRDELRASRKSIAKLTRESNSKLKAARESRKKLKREYTGLQQMNTRALAQIESIRSERDALSNTTQHLEKRLASAVENRNQTAARIRAVRADLDDSQRERDATSAVNAMLRERIDSLTSTTEPQPQPIAPSASPGPEHQHPEPAEDAEVVNAILLANAREWQWNREDRDWSLIITLSIIALLGFAFGVTSIIVLMLD